MRVLSPSKTVKMLYIAPGECIPRDGNDVAHQGNDCAIFVKSAKKTGGDLPSVLGVEYTLSKTVSGKSAVISENQTATSDREAWMFVVLYCI